MTEETHFHHQKNIQVGRGRILYDETGGIKGGQWHPPGWVLPGGARTGDFTEAYKAAEEIDRLSGGQQLPIGVAG